MAVEYLIGEVPGSVEERVALVDSVTSVCVPVHTFRSPEAAEDFLTYVRENQAGVDVRQLNQRTLSGLWNNWWEERGKSLA